MKIILLCSTQRGFEFLKKLYNLCYHDQIIVFTFRETPFEPKFLDDIKSFCQRNSLNCFETKNVADKNYKDIWDDSIDLVFLVHWRYLLPIQIVDNVKIGAIVLHDSLLPKYGGFSPTVWAMINGETECGVSMFYLDREVDAGDIIAQEGVKIESGETISEVMEKVTTAYLNLLESNIELLKTGKSPRISQDNSLATYTCKRTPEDNLIDWQQPSQKIYNLIQAVSYPYTGAYTFYRGRKLKVWSAKPDCKQRKYVGNIPGRVIEIRPQEGVVVLSGDGALLVSMVELEGEIKTNASELIKSIADKLG